MTEAERPVWACNQWGNYEHDWLDCSDCLINYDEYIEQQYYEPPE